MKHYTKYIFSILFCCFSFFLKAQSIEKVCSSNNLPPGWVIVDIDKDCKCCGFKRGDTLRITQYYIQNLDKMPINSIVKVCNKSSIPKGWVIINQIKNCQDCGDTTQTQFEIKRIWIQKDIPQKVHIDIGN